MSSETLKFGHSNLFTQIANQLKDSQKDNPKLFSLSYYNKLSDKKMLDRIKKRDDNVMKKIKRD